jgi:hypothetical protein
VGKKKYGLSAPPCEEVLPTLSVRLVNLLKRLLGDPFQTELLMNNHAILFDIRPNGSADEGGTDNQHQSVRTISYIRR